MKSKNWTLARLSSLTIIFILMLSACSNDKKNDSKEDLGNTSNEENVTYVDDVEQIITNSCITCHGDNSPTMAKFGEDPEKYKALSQGPRLDTYENLTAVVNGSEAGALMRRLDNGENKDDGKPGNMYQYLGLTDEEREEQLEILKEWVGHWILKRENELTDEDREKFIVAEK
ncbi:c-type cytochrome [Sporosarcina sp. FA9]|uniref:c-type cytochrome n=1 Tax=Sporosarcina sp. FA9 TaxID=3413030 RepID=UPI003F6555BC